MQKGVAALLEDAAKGSYYVAEVHTPTREKTMISCSVCQCQLTLLLSMARTAGRSWRSS